MRILQVILAPRLSGAEVLAKGVAIEHQQAGHSVGMVSLMPEHQDFRQLRDELKARGVVCIFPDHMPGKAGRLLFLHRAVRRFKPDIMSRTLPSRPCTCACCPRAYRSSGSCIPASTISPTRR